MKLKYTREEKHEIITTLLKEQNISERELARQTGIPRSTINDWATLRQDNTGKNVHVSFGRVVLRLQNTNASDVEDWGRIEQMHEETKRLLDEKK